MDHLDANRIIEIATRKVEPTPEERNHLKDCQRCRHLIVNLSLKTPAKEEKQ